jgi:hypothetical protein
MTREELHAAAVELERRLREGVEEVEPGSRKRSSSSKLNAFTS